jgi:hypothetical protein
MNNLWEDPSVSSAGSHVIIYVCTTPVGLNHIGRGCLMINPIDQVD